MTRARICLVWGATGALTMACAAGSDGAPDPELPASSWDVTLPFEVTPPLNLPSPLQCPTPAFTLRLEPEPGGLSATLSSDGRLWQGHLAARTGTYDLVAPVEVPLPGGCQLISLQVTALALRASDTDGDGRADHLTGEGTGSGNSIYGPSHFFPTSIRLAGTPDITPPHLIVPEAAVNPIDGARLIASEALAPTASLSLQGDPTVELRSESDPGLPLVAASAVAILPFAGSWIVTGSAQDQAGHPVETGQRLTTLADPGLFAPDGFEGPMLAASLEGRFPDAQLVATVGGLPALAGSQSLLLGAGTSATFHLSRPAGATAARFVYRALSGGECPSTIDETLAPAVAGVVGGGRLPSSSRTISGNLAIDNGRLSRAGPLQEVWFPLDQPGNDIVVRFASAKVASCTPAAFLIDDLRVE